MCKYSLFTKKIFLSLIAMLSMTSYAQTKSDLVVYGFDNQGICNYDLVNSSSAQSTTWSQFSKWVLLDALNGMAKADFDMYYTLDVTSDPAISLADGGKQYNAKLYKDTDGNIDTYSTASGVTYTLGQMRYIYDSEGSNNHTYSWSFSREDLEYLTHDKVLPATHTQYIRYIGSSNAKYKYIYVKFTSSITRDPVHQTGLIGKTDNYWFGYDGSDSGWDALAFNIGFPQNDVTPVTWNSNLLNSFLMNKLQFSNSSYGTTTSTRKFFFVPKNTEIVDQDGNAWILTPRQGCNDEKWNSLVCAYDLHCESKYEVHKWGDDYQLNSIMNKCAIAYNDGAFTNIKLYAVKKNQYFMKSSYTLIAQMNAQTGDVAIVRNSNVAGTDLDKILNAIGYASDHANISQEMHAYVGVAVKDLNGGVVDVYNEHGTNNSSYGIWTVSWQRPINIIPMEGTICQGQKVHVDDLLFLYDWRGPVQGSMNSSDKKWLWAYYGIKSITIDCDPNDVTTSFGGHNLDVTTLSSITEPIKFYASTAYDMKKIYSFDISSYNSTYKSRDLYNLISGNDNFGAIQCVHSGSDCYNITPYQVKIPVSIEYEWGTVKTYIILNVIPNTITDIEENAVLENPNSKAYNVSGQITKYQSKGVKIINGKKIAVK